MIRKYVVSALLLCASAPSAQAEITFMIGEPLDGSTRSGVGLISGWAVSDRGIVSVEGFIDGKSIGVIPYGSSRGDVQAAYPDIPGSLNSGWGMKWAYSLTGEGEHSLRIVVTEQGGGTAEQTVDYTVVAFESEFISDPGNVVTAGATIGSPEDGRLVIEGARIEGAPVDIQLAWDTGSQQFLIDRISYDGEVKSQQAPSASAGADLSVEVGSDVSVSGEGSDPDGYISSRRWTQVSGPNVTLENSDQWTVSFRAPSSPGTVRLRLQVTDDDGLSASDDVSIEVYESNNKPNASAGPNITVDTGSQVSLTGSASDSDGQITAWEWERVSGLAVNLQDAGTQTVRFTAPDAEGYTRLRLRVWDDDGASDYDDVLVYYEDPTPVNQSPTADAGRDQTVETGDSVSISGSASDPDGSIANWSWQQVSGSAVSLSGADSRTVSFTAPGSATDIRLRLTVTDNGGATDSDDVIIRVEEPAGSGTTTGNALQSMLDELNDARGTARTCEDGGQVFPAQPALQWSANLADIATQHSMDMAAKGYFSHTSADGTTMSQRVRPYWPSGWIGENIAASSIDRSDQYVIDMWLNSKGHCELIMSPNFSHAGIGVGRDEQNGYTYHHFWTLNFGG